MAVALHLIRIARRNKRKINKLTYLKLYHSLIKITIVSVCLVICAGGFVRMTGSGMGCPDWPKCFGYWIPPTDVSQLPLDYKEQYSERGYDKLDFNVFNTWTEYVNRLLGALAGFFCLGLLIISIFISNTRLILFSFFLVLLMGFQGWMGAQVVASVLSPYKITIHYLIALFILSLLFFMYRSTLPIAKDTLISINKKVLLFGIFISISQIVLGTQVRESVDQLLISYDRISIISHLPITFEYHRTMAWLVLVSNIAILFSHRILIKNLVELKIIILAISVLVLTGWLMTKQSLIPLCQLMHVICAVSLFICQLSIFLRYFNLAIVKSP